MADKLVAVRIKQQDNTYSNEIPIGTWAENVAYDNTKNLLQVLGTIDMYKGDVQTQLNALFENFNGIAEDVAGAIDDWVTEHMPSWDPETHLDDTLMADNLAPVSSAVPKLIAINEAEIQGTKMKISTTGQQDLTVLTPSDIDNTLSQQGEAADAKATGEMIMINNVATAGTKIRITTTNDDISLVTTNGQPFVVRKINAQIKDPTTGEMIPVGILSSDSLTTITAAENSAITRITNTKTSAINQITQMKETIPSDYADFAAEAAYKDMIAQTQAAMTATKTYATGEYICVNKKLYKTTTAITSGLALVVGTNIEEVKLAESVSASAAQIAMNTSDISDLKESINQRGIPAGGSTGQSLRKKSGTNYDMEWTDVGLPTDEQTADAVSAWLDEHPEATTTVEDHSLTYEKLVIGTLGFVTPEMFGAKGDGINDDTNAWQNAVDSGYSVKALSKIYKCGQINVTKNIEIDCNWAEFIATENRLFNCYGEVKNTLSNQSDFTTGKEGYEISTDYSGYAMIRGTNNPFLVRNNYRAGMVGYFKNGKFTETTPVNIESPSVDLIVPITCKIKNIANVLFLSTHDGYVIRCKHGAFCAFENINITNEAYSVVYLEQCYRCELNNITAILNDYTGEQLNIYPICMIDTCYTYILNCKIYNVKWECITTGGNYFCISNTINHCECWSGASRSVSDHENAIGTTVKDSACGGINIAQGGTVEDCTIFGKTCSILVIPSVVKTLANYTLKNIKFNIDTTTSGNIGITVRGYPQVTGQTAYINNIDIENIHSIEGVAGGLIISFFDLASSFSKVYIFTVNISKFSGYVNFYSGTTYADDYTNAKISINDCNNKMLGTADRYLQILMPDSGDVIVSNCTLFNFNYTGTNYPNNLYLNNIITTASTCALKSNLTIIGNGIYATGNINLDDTNRISISNLCRVYQSLTYSYVWRIAKTRDCFAKQMKYDGTEELVTLVTAS